MAYIVDGNLYVQDGSSPPRQLSNSGEDLYPMFSDDGEKIIFYRGKALEYHNSVFSVNADGSDMREIITKDWLDTLGAGTKAGHLAFVPNTHQILFNTYLCPKYDPSFSSGCTVGLFLIDSDTGKIKEILQPVLGGGLPWHGDSPWLGNFSVSPDGKLLAVAHAGQIDVLNIDGKVIHQSIMKYISDMPSELYPRMYWFSDLSGLIVALPAEVDYRGPGYSGDPTYTIWRYTFDGNMVAQIPLDPSPVWIHMESNDMISVSPNREWAIYFTEEYRLYKGNLLDGNSAPLLPYGWFLPTQWNSDSTYFAIGANASEALLGSVDASPGYPPGYLIGWIDAKRFVYFPLSAYMSKDNIPVLVGEIDGKALSSYETKVFVPNVTPYSYSFALTVLESK
jgi:hypothetical protein